MGELPAGVSIAEAIAAFHTVEAFWVALSNDDDRAVRLLIGEAAQAKYGWTAQGLARQVRATLGVTSGQCASMGTSNRVRILAGGELAFWSMPVWHDTLIDAPTLVAGWGWQVEQVGDGSWQLLQMPDSGDLRAAPQFSLPEGTEAEALVANAKATPARAKASPPPIKAAEPIKAPPAEVASAPVVTAPPAEPRVKREPVAVPVERQSPREAAAVAVPVEREPAREAVPIALRVGATRAVARADAPPAPPAPVASLAVPAPPAPRARVAVPEAIPSRIQSEPAPAREPVAVPVRPAPVDRADGLPPEPLSPLAVRRILGLPQQKSRRSHRARVLGASFVFGFVAALGIVITVGSQLRR